MVIFLSDVLASGKFMFPVFSELRFIVLVFSFMLLLLAWTKTGLILKYIHSVMKTLTCRYSCSVGCRNTSELPKYLVLAVVKLSVNGFVSYSQLST